MTILFFSRLFYPHIGGVETHVWEISKILIKKGHAVTVVTEKYQEDLKDKETFKGIAIYRVPVGKNEKNKKWEIWKWLFNHREIIKEADVVHCHDVFFWYLPFRFLYPAKKVYTTFHGYESFPVKKKAIIVRKISEKLSNGSICIGEFMKKWYFAKPDYTSYGGVSIKKNFKNVPHKASAVFIGRLDEQTGILDYAKAVIIIKEKIPNFYFLIIGDGKFRSEVEKDFAIKGFYNNAQKFFEKYRFAFISRYLALLEAMAAKRLIFALYDNMLKRDYLQMTPFAKWIVIENSPEKLAEKVLYYLRHPKEEKQLTQNAYEWVKNQTWDTVVHIYLKLWQL